MKRLIVLIFIASLLFAVTPVQRTKETNDNKTSQHKTEIVTSEKTKKTMTKKSKDEKEKDSFIDADSNSVNDQREDDLQKIKWLNSKFKDFFKKKAEKPEGSRSKQTRPEKNKLK